MAAHIRLRHCPHCLGSAELVPDPDSPEMWRVTCGGLHDGLGCGALTPAYALQVEAAKYWNQRGLGLSSYLGRLAPMPCPRCGQYASVNVLHTDKHYQLVPVCAQGESDTACELLDAMPEEPDLFIGYIAPPDGDPHDQGGGHG